MSIKVQCEHCHANLTVNDKMAGKRGKCPKCAGVITIPAATNGGSSLAAGVSPASTSASSGGWGKGHVHSPLDDLLDEAGVEAASTGPTCPACHADVKPNAVLCVECGYNFTAGRQIRTQIGFDPDAADAGLSENEKLMAKAEREIDDAPITVEDGEHGDGAESFLIAIGMLVVGATMLAAGIGIVYLMDRVIKEGSMSLTISLVICCVLTGISQIWLLICAFREKPLQGILVLFVPFYIYYYGFTRWTGLWIPTAMLVLGTVGGFGSTLAIMWAANAPPS